MLKILSLSGYTIPMYGSKRISPYGDLEVTDGKTVKVCLIQVDQYFPWQYIVFAGKRVYVRNAGRLYSPRFVIVGSTEDCMCLLDEAGLKYTRDDNNKLVVFVKGHHIPVESVDPNLSDVPWGYCKINGELMDFREWVKKASMQNKIWMRDVLKVQIPGGYLLVEKKGAVDEYPGVFVSFSKDGEVLNEQIATVEYDTADKIIQTVTYHPGSDEPTHVIRASDGQEKEN